MDSASMTLPILPHQEDDDMAAWRQCFLTTCYYLCVKLFGLQILWKCKFHKERPQLKLQTSMLMGISWKILYPEGPVKQKLAPDLVIFQGYVRHAWKGNFDKNDDGKRYPELTLDSI